MSKSPLLITARKDRHLRQTIQNHAGCSSLYLGLAYVVLFAVGIIVGTSSLFLMQSPSSSASSSLFPANPIQSLSQFSEPSLLFTRPALPLTVGYAVSLIKCQDKQSTPEGLVDAALVLRHSIHRAHATSRHYDYQMYAFVHPDAVGCSNVLNDAGFTVLVRDSPVHAHEIQGEHLRKHIDREWCCGSAEFIKLQAYQLTKVALVVHMDMDFLMLKPMDHVFDAMLYDSTSKIGSEARSVLETEFPDRMLPERIDAVMTRDWPQVIPGRKAGFQAGFLIVRPDPALFDVIVDVIRHGDYVDGFGRDNGWGGRGYGAFVGAQAMQGLLAFVYDAILYDSWVELNQCRFNHIGMDVLYRNPPSFNKRHAKVGMCRNDRNYCEDCMVTPLTKIYNIHYNQCRKPWNCIGEGNRERANDKFAIPEDQVHKDHCLELVAEWHSVRSDLESQLKESVPALSAAPIMASTSGNYKHNHFQGHCLSYGTEGYLRLAGGDTSLLRKIPQLYVKSE